MHLTCSSCDTEYLVVGPDRHLRVLSNSTPTCLTPGCGTNLAPTVVGTGCVKVVPVSSFLRSTIGLEVGDLSPAEANRVKSLLTESKIVAAQVDSVGDPPRCIIRDVVLDSGIRLHFASSNEGACVYLIEEAVL